jgi:hypothetical protein
VYLKLQAAAPLGTTTYVRCPFRDQILSHIPTVSIPLHLSLPDCHNRHCPAPVIRASPSVQCAGVLPVIGAKSRFSHVHAHDQREPPCLHYSVDAVALPARLPKYPGTCRLYSFAPHRLVASPHAQVSINLEPSQIFATSTARPIGQCIFRLFSLSVRRLRSIPCPVPPWSCAACG